MPLTKPPAGSREIAYPPLGLCFLMADNAATGPVSFDQFFHQVFLKEHTHPVNVALHVAGTILSALLIPYAIATRRPWFLLLWPLLIIVPGGIGHRFFERNFEVGDVRVLRNDYPKLWFLWGNNAMVWELITKGFHWGKKAV